MKIRFEPDIIWYDEAVVKVSETYIKQKLVRFKIEAGNNINGLNEGLGLLDSWTFSSVQWSLIAFHSKKISIQAHSPTEIPQTWKIGCLNSLAVPFFPSDSKLLEYLWGKWGRELVWKSLRAYF